MDWHNWSGSVAARPQRIERPKTRAELAGLIQAADKVRVTGAGHSFMPLCETSGTLLSMGDYEGGIDIASDRRTAETKHRRINVRQASKSQPQSRW